MEETKQEVQHIFVGKKVSKELDEVIEEKLYTIKRLADPEVKIIYLSDEEMRRATATRIKLKENETVQTFLIDENNKKDAVSLTERLRKAVKDAYKSEDVFLPEIDIKNLTSFSWSKFRTTLKTLDLFGHVETNENGAIRFRLEDESRDLNELIKVQNSVEELIVTIEQAEAVIKDKDIRKKMASLKRKLIATDL